MRTTSDPMPAALIVVLFCASFFVTFMGLAIATASDHHLHGAGLLVVGVGGLISMWRQARRRSAAQHER